jgi:hypothetical protein
MAVPLSAQAVLDPGAERRPDLRGVKLLLPVWGRCHLDQFLNASLPSLLWPGNLPALVDAMPCEFVAMTGSDDAETLAAHPNWHRLERICPVRVVAIDDLISDASYAVTITLAYTQAMRAAGAAMLDTGFIFLVADFLVADGSLGAVLARLRGGADGVLAGNFQVAAEAVGQSWPDGSIDTGVPLTPRQLVRWSLDHLHPQTVRAIVNAGYRRTETANRLFWCVDRNTLLGRFYLLHMIGIRPEIRDFTIGAACDYSFIPELCPSNRVVVLTDSDEYFVTEMQSTMNARGRADKAPALDPRLVAGDLSRWTTTRHRENARHSVLLHAADLPERLSEIETEAEALIDAIGRRLATIPQSHRHHPYWIGGTALHQATTGTRELGRGRGLSAATTRLWWRMRLSGFGRPPETRPWHPRWPDFSAAGAQLDFGGTLLILSDEPRSFERWTSRVAGKPVSIRRKRFDPGPARLQIGEAGPFDCCLLVLPEDDACGIGPTVDSLASVLKPGGKVIVLVIKDLRDNPSVLEPTGTAAIERGLAATGWTMQSSYLPAGAIRHALQQGLVASARATRHRSQAIAIAAILACIALAPLSWACNEIALRTTTRQARHPCSSALFMMRKGEEE